MVPTRNISLTREQDRFVDQIVRSGEYQNASEALRDALRALQQRRREQALKVELLRRELAKGIDAHDRGEFDEVSLDELGAYVRKIARPARRGGRRKHR